MFLPKTASDFQDKMDQFKKAAEGFKGQVGKLETMIFSNQSRTSFLFSVFFYSMGIHTR